MPIDIARKMYLSPAAQGQRARSFGLLICIAVVQRIQPGRKKIYAETLANGFANCITDAPSSWSTMCRPKVAQIEAPADSKLGGNLRGDPKFGSRPIKSRNTLGERRKWQPRAIVYVASMSACRTGGLFGSASAQNGAAS